MAFIDWSEALCVGVLCIDQQHKNLIELLNKIYEAMKAHSSSAYLTTLFVELGEHTKTHFDHEEQLFARANYPYLEGHRNEHNDLLKQYAAFLEKYRADPEGTLTMDFMNTLRHWLMDHVLREDKQGGAYLVFKGIH